jgi:glycine betaine transporter
MGSRRHAGIPIPAEPTLFATGMGIGLIFWGVAEPMSHLLTPPMEITGAESPEAAALGMQYTIFHWGLHPWALYGIVGLTLAYASPG